MDIFDFGGDVAQTYTETCKGCNTDTQVSTQQDRCSEYATLIYVKCRCGESVRFNLPVG